MAGYNSNSGGSIKNSFNCPIFGEPGILGPIPLTNAATEFQTLIDIPWKNCRLAEARFDVTTAIDSTGSMVIQMELNAADGTAMMTCSPSASAAVASQTYGTVSSAAACNKLDRDNADRDKINISVDGSTAAAGAGMLWLFFEPANLD